MTCSEIGRSGAVDGCARNDAADVVLREVEQDLLPDPFVDLANSSDVGAQITALLVTLGHEQKQAARASREVAERAQRSAEDQQLDEMRAEANMRLASGIVEGTAKIVSGAFKLGGARDREAAGDRWRARADLADGAGKIVATSFTHAADVDATDAKRAEHVAGREKRAADDARDLEDDARQLVQRALEYYKEYLTAKNDTQRASFLRA